MYLLYNSRRETHALAGSIDLESRKKVKVEEAIGREGLPVGVLRLTKVLAAEPAGLFEAWLGALRRGEPIVAATNMAIAPIAAPDVAAAAVALGTGRRMGLWHLSSADELDYHAAAQLMATSCRLPLGLVHGRPVGEAEVSSIFRHRHAALGAAKIARELGFPLRRFAPPAKGNKHGGQFIVVRKHRCEQSPERVGQLLFDGTPLAARRNPVYDRPAPGRAPRRLP